LKVVPFAQLTEDQQNVVQAPITSSRIVMGGPGSGKSLVLVHRANFAVTTKKIKPNKTLLVTYTKRLKAELMDGLRKLDLKDVSVVTFDALCWNLYRKLLPKSPTPNPKTKNASSIVRQALLKELTENPIGPIYDFSLVDEAQDLDRTALSILAKISKTSTVAMDVRQQIYGIEMNPEIAASILGVGVKQQTLLNAFRCTPNIVQLGSIFLESEEETKHFLGSNLLVPDEVETPKLTYFESVDKEMDALKEALIERGQLGQTVLILAPKNEYVADIVREMSERGVRVLLRDDSSIRGNIPEALTFHSAKGLTVDAVFLPSLDRVEEIYYREWNVPNLLFVAVTRATHYVWIGLPADSKWDYIPAIEKLGEEGYVHISKDGGRLFNVNFDEPPVGESEDWHV
jgi:superfamily I DNA/RNA helicase